jgi:SAM-dependent methyltransferase
MRLERGPDRDPPSWVRKNARVVGRGGGYDAFAREYYEPAHTTSRNFDAATARAVGDWPSRLPTGLILEPGCGRGRVGEFLGVKSDRVVQMDNSPAMLSLVLREEARVRVLHDAERLPFPDGEFGSVVAFLCDAFLGLNFLSEAHRVLQPGGVLCGTTPSHEWGVALRDELGIDVMSTRFILKDGVTLVSSFLYPQAQLKEMLVRTGFSEVEIRAHSVPDDVTTVSEDIVRPAERLGKPPHELPVLYSFLALA